MTELGFDDVYGLIADLTEIPNVVNRKVEQAVQQTAIRTKKAWAEQAVKGPMGDQYAPTIDYELREFGAFGQGQYSAEIGPDLARYGGHTGKGGLVPSMGILDDPQSTGNIKTPPSRARRKAEKFAVEELLKGIDIAVTESHKEVGL